MLHFIYARHILFNGNGIGALGQVLQRSLIAQGNIDLEAGLQHLAIAVSRYLVWRHSRAPEDQLGSLSDGTAKLHLLDFSKAHSQFAGTYLIEIEKGSLLSIIAGKGDVVPVGVRNGVGVVSTTLPSDVILTVA